MVAVFCVSRPSCRLITRNVALLLWVVAGFYCPVLECLFALSRGVPVGRVFPFVPVSQLCLGVLQLLDFFGVVYYPTVHRVTETVHFSLGFSLLVPLLVLMVAWVVCFHTLGEGVEVFEGDAFYLVVFGGGDEDGSPSWGVFDVFSIGFLGESVSGGFLL